MMRRVRDAPLLLLLLPLLRRRPGTSAQARPPRAETSRDAGGAGSSTDRHKDQRGSEGAGGEAQRRARSFERKRAKQASSDSQENRCV